jgi:hypothetical protein
MEIAFLYYSASVADTKRYLAQKQGGSSSSLWLQEPYHQKAIGAE